MTAARDEAVVVVGAGQAGLATGFHLQRAGVPCTILESRPVAGGAWLDRWDSLRLFTSARFSALPERPLPGDGARYPLAREIADYLRDYPAAFDLPVRYGITVSRVVAGEDGLTVETDHGPVRARAVVAATGSFQRPRIPAVAAQLPPHVHQRHSSEYRSPDELPGSSVLVVGAGNSGLQIAAELAGSRPVHLAVGSRQMPLPQRVLGRDVFWWLDRVGLTRAPIDRLPSWLAGDGDVLIGQSVAATRRLGVAVHARLVGVADDQVVFEDGERLRVDTVLWATGYRPDYSWLPPAAVDAEGRPVHRRGVSPQAGVYFVGVENQYSTASSLIGWVQRDAEFIAGRAATHVGPAPA